MGLMVAELAQRLPVLLVGNKQDRVTGDNRRPFKRRGLSGVNSVDISATEGNDVARECEAKLAPFLHRQRAVVVCVCVGKKALFGEEEKADALKLATAAAA